MKILLLVGNDKLGKKFLNEINVDKYVVALDKSMSIKRVYNLLKKKIISPLVMFKMFVAELLRKNYKLPNKKYYYIKNNNDLLNLIIKKNIELVVIFRGGLIINKKILNIGIDILNIHCAKVPEYGGIGVIQRALDDGVYKQEATLYKITEKIDNGEVIKTKKYILDPCRSYLYNENLAYETGIKLFKEHFE